GLGDPAVRPGSFPTGRLDAEPGRRPSRHGRCFHPPFFCGFLLVRGRGRGFGTRRRASLHPLLRRRSLSFFRFRGCGFFRRPFWFFGCLRFFFFRCFRFFLRRPFLFLLRSFTI